MVPSIAGKGSAGLPMNVATVDEQSWRAVLAPYERASLKLWDEETRALVGFDAVDEHEAPRAAARLARAGREPETTSS